MFLFNWVIFWFHVHLPGCMLVTWRAVAWQIFFRKIQCRELKERLRVGQLHRFICPLFSSKHSCIITCFGVLIILPSAFGRNLTPHVCCQATDDGEKKLVQRCVHQKFVASFRHWVVWFNEFAWSFLAVACVTGHRGPFEDVEGKSETYNMCI